MKIVLLFALIGSAVGATIPEKTEVVPDVTSSLLTDTKEMDRVKKASASKTTCYETELNGKSILQCADEPEMAETFSAPAFQAVPPELPKIPGFTRHASAFPGLELPPINLSGLNTIPSGMKVSVGTSVEIKVDLTQPKHTMSPIMVNIDAIVIFEI